MYVWGNDASSTAQQVTHTDNICTRDMFRSLAVYLTTLSAYSTYGRIVGWFVNWNGRERRRPLPNLETCCPAICLEDWETTKELVFRTGTSLIEVESLFSAADMNDILQSHSGVYLLALSDRFITTFWYAVPSVPFMVWWCVYLIINLWICFEPSCRATPCPKTLQHPKAKVRNLSSVLVIT